MDTRYKPQQIIIAFPLSVFHPKPEEMSRKCINPFTHSGSIWPNDFQQEMPNFQGG